MARSLLHQMVLKYFVYSLDDNKEKNHDFLNHVSKYILDENCHKNL